VKLKQHCYNQISTCVAAELHTYMH